MDYFLGIDTSNYTTSAALALENGEIISCKKLLPVRQGNIGLRQSDAVFHHTQQLPEIIKELFCSSNGSIRAVGASTRPRTVEGSYMPCFTVGSATANIISTINNVPCYGYSHQQGHITAGLYSSNRLDLLLQRFLAFHISGGTTEALLVDSKNSLLNCNLVAKTLDLNAGQVIDRVGVMLDLPFPCGKHLEQLSNSCQEEFKIKPTLKENNCCLSGLENICKKMYSDGSPREYVAKYCLTYVESTLREMCENLLVQYGDIPVLFVGGVMSNKTISKSFTRDFGGIFAKPEFSADNAAGIAVLTKLKYSRVI